MDSVAITDHGGLYGAISFYKKRKRKILNQLLELNSIFLQPQGLIKGKRR